MKKFFFFFFFFSSRRRHTRCGRDWSSDVCSSDLDARFDDEGEADALDEPGLLSRKARVGHCEPVIAKETVSQVLIIGDPHDVRIADDDVGSEPLLPARAVVGEKDELDISAGN